MNLALCEETFDYGLEQLFSAKNYLGSAVNPALTAFSVDHGGPTFYKIQRLFNGLRRDTFGDRFMPMHLIDAATRKRWTTQPHGVSMPITRQGFTAAK